MAGSTCLGGVRSFSKTDEEHPSGSWAGRGVKVILYPEPLGFGSPVVATGSRFLDRGRGCNASADGSTPPPTATLSRQRCSIARSMRRNSLDLVIGELTSERHRGSFGAALCGERRDDGHAAVAVITCPSINDLSVAASNGTVHRHPQCSAPPRRMQSESTPVSVSGLTEAPRTRKSIVDVSADGAGAVGQRELSVIASRAAWLYA